MVLFVLFFIVAAAVGLVSYFVGQQRIRDISTFAAAPGLTVLGPNGKPLLTVAPVAPGSRESQMVTVGAEAGPTEPE